MRLTLWISVGLGFGLIGSPGVSGSDMRVKAVIGSAMAFTALKRGLEERMETKSL
jgi:hypothetical protein